MNKARSDFLFATPTFISGAARALDLYGVYDSYNASSTDYEADYKAALSDWRTVGEDIFSAMQQFEDSLPPGSVATRDEPCEASRQLSFFE